MTDLKDKSGEFLKGWTVRLYCKQKISYIAEDLGFWKQKCTIYNFRTEILVAQTNWF